MPRDIILIILNYGIRIVTIILCTYIFKLIQKYELEQWVKFSVKAAEQIFNTPGLGKEKKDYVKNQVMKKFTISEEELDILIEAFVEELNRVKEIESLNN